PWLGRGTMTDVGTALPLNAVRPSATRKTADRRTRRATRRARRAVRACRRSTRRLPVRREDGMSRGTLSHCRSSSQMSSAKFPRGPAVGLVYLAFAAVVALAILALATVVVQQTRSAAHRVDHYFTTESGHPSRTGAEHDLARFQLWLDHHHLSGVHVQRQGE